jgi:hypothetical protein
MSGVGVHGCVWCDSVQQDCAESAASALLVLLAALLSCCLDSPAAGLLCLEVLAAVLGD